MNTPSRVNILGVGVHALDLPGATALIVEAARARSSAAGPRIVCCCDVNNISSARRDPAHRSLLNRAWLVTPDGMPVVWLARRAGHRSTGRVYGPDLLRSICAADQARLAHFFYGGAPGVAAALAARLRSDHPTLKIAGTFAPPMSAAADLPLDPLLATDAPLIWIGLGTPKQEALMARLAAAWPAGKPAPILLGVGAAFDFLTGRVRQAPLAFQHSGLEWLWRLAHEPRRLGPRYLKNNPLFLLRTFAQLTHLRHYPLE